MKILIALILAVFISASHAAEVKAVPYVKGSRVLQKAREQGKTVQRAQAVFVPGSRTATVNWEQPFQRLDYDVIISPAHTNAVVKSRTSTNSIIEVPVAFTKTNVVNAARIE